LPLRRPPSSTLFPYTALFRSVRELHPRLGVDQAFLDQRVDRLVESLHAALRPGLDRAPELGDLTLPDQLADVGRHQHQLEGEDRSEEHTSELQSRENLVCRLL